MNNTRCTAPRCRLIGVHGPNCVNELCRGCEPRPAADGLRLCYPHAGQIGQNAIAAAELYDDLVLVLTPLSGPSEVVSGTKERGVGLNEAAVEARSRIRAVLVAWTRLVADERGISHPADTLRDMATFLDRNSEWLATHEAAGDVVEELYELAWGRPRQVAYPGGHRAMWLCHCPVEGCEGNVKAKFGPGVKLTPAEVACDVDPDHRWPESHWLDLAEAVAS